MYFHTDDPSMIGYIADVAKTAEDTGTRLRLDVDSQGNLRIKRGEGRWSPLFSSTPDPYRDETQSVSQNFCPVCGQPDNRRQSRTLSKCGECDRADGKHFLSCSIWQWQHGQTD